MKKLTIAMLLVFMMGITAFAQETRQKERPTPEERAQKQTEMMAKQLELSDDQKAQILAINLENAKKREAEMEARKSEMDSRREQMRAQDEAIKKVLTEEQRTKWEELKESQRDRRGRRPGGEIRERGDMPQKRGGN